MPETVKAYPEPRRVVHDGISLFLPDRNQVFIVFNITPNRSLYRTWFYLFVHSCFQPFFCFPLASFCSIFLDMASPACKKYN